MRLGSAVTAPENWKGSTGRTSMGISLASILLDQRLNFSSRSGVLLRSKTKHIVTLFLVRHDLLLSDLSRSRKIAKAYRLRSTNISLRSHSVPEDVADEVLQGEQVFRRRDLRHGELVSQGAGLVHVERRLEDQYGLPMLDGLHRAHAETTAVPNDVHLVQHRDAWVT